MDGVKVYDARGNMGEKLAQKLFRIFPDHDIDHVIPIPETSRTAALQCATILGRPYREGFVKNRYIARTFIMPGQEMRRKTVRLKLNTIRSEFDGKVVLLIDDSIVRGTTSMELIQMAREAGAKKVYFASAAPPVRYPNVYGIDIPTRFELIAHDRDEEQIKEELRADMIIYNDLEDVLEAVRSLNALHLSRLEDSCFSGHYVTEEVTTQFLLSLEKSRGLGRTGTASPHLTAPQNGEIVKVKGGSKVASSPAPLIQTPHQAAALIASLDPARAREIEMKSFAFSEEIQQHLYQFPSLQQNKGSISEQKVRVVEESEAGAVEGDESNSNSFENSQDPSMDSSHHGGSVFPSKGTGCEMIHNQL